MLRNFSYRFSNVIKKLFQKLQKFLSLNFIENFLFQVPIYDIANILKVERSKVKKLFIQLSNVNMNLFEKCKKDLPSIFLIIVNFFWLKFTIIIYYRPPLSKTLCRIILDIRHQISLFLAGKNGNTPP